jgi:hypothetical protein
MALFYRIEDIRGGGKKTMTLARAKAIVARELMIRPLYVSIDPDGEYIRVEFATPKPRRRARPSRRRKPQKSSNSLKFIGIEFTPR